MFFFLSIMHKTFREKAASPDRNCTGNPWYEKNTGLMLGGFLTGALETNQTQSRSHLFNFSVRLRWKNTYDGCTCYDISTFNRMGKSYDMLNQLWHFFQSSVYRFPARTCLVAIWSIQKTHSSLVHVLILNAMDSTACTRSSLHVKQMWEAKQYLSTQLPTVPTKTVRQGSRACTKAFLYEVLLICKYTLSLKGLPYMKTWTCLPQPHSFNEGILAAHQNDHRDGDVCVMGQADGSQVRTTPGQWTSNCPLEQERLRDASVILITWPMWVVKYSWDEIQACVKCVFHVWEREYVQGWVWGYNLVPYFHQKFGWNTAGKSSESVLPQWKTKLCTSLSNCAFNREIKKIIKTYLLGDASACESIKYDH